MDTAVVKIQNKPFMNLNQIATNVAIVHHDESKTHKRSTISNPQIMSNYYSSRLVVLIMCFMYTYFPFACILLFFIAC